MFASNDGPLSGSKAKENGQSQLCLSQGNARPGDRRLRVSVAVGRVSGVRLPSSISMCPYCGLFEGHMSHGGRECSVTEAVGLGIAGRLLEQIKRLCRRQTEQETGAA